MQLCANILQKIVRTAANITSTLLAHYVAPKLETILDREAKISHEAFAGQIEGRLGYNDKGPDMKVWSKGRGLNDVGWFEQLVSATSDRERRLTGPRPSSAILPSSSRSRQVPVTTSAPMLSPRQRTSRTRACSLSRLVCDTRVTVQISVGASWSIHRRWVTYLACGF